MPESAASDPSDFPSLPETLGRPTVGAESPGEGGSDGTPERLGEYDILGVLGRGGMGVVYKARHRNLGRLVALKVVLAGEHSSPESRLRFLNEARSIAQLQHQNIVQIYEVGTHNGLPFIALELLSGGTLEGKIAGKPQSVAETATIIETLARATHAAHQKGIIHRDLKPANILLSEMGEPKITDFGLAKQQLLGQGLTASGELLGTPAYMAPEQARGESSEASPATDVHALGVLLYEMLSGRPPFQGANMQETFELVLTREAPPPSRLRPGVPRDLDTIALRCLEKQPRRRYSSALELAEELRRWRAGEPIMTRPVSSWTRAVKWVRRRPTLAGLLAASTVAVMALVGVAVSMFYGRQLAQTASELRESYEAEAVARRRAEEAEQLSTEQGRKLKHAYKQTEDALNLANTYAYFHRIALADAAIRDVNIARAEALLSECPQQKRQWEWGQLMQRCRVPLYTISTGHKPTFLYSAISADGRLVATVSMSGTVALMEIPSGRELWFKKSGSDVAFSVAISPDGTQVAVAGAEGKMILLSAKDGKVIHALHGHKAHVRHLAYRGDGKELASASLDARVILWDPLSGKQMGTLTGHRGGIIKLAYNPIGTALASASWDGTVKIWDVAKRRLKRTINGGEGSLTACTWSPDGRVIASGGLKGLLTLWDSGTGDQALQVTVHSSTIQEIAFSPDATRVATCSSDGTINVLHLLSRRSVQSLGHRGHVTSIAFHPEADRLITTGHDATVRLWDVTKQPEVVHVEGKGMISPIRVLFSVDGNRVFTFGFDHAVQMRDAQSGELLRTFASLPAGLDGPRLFPTLSPDGRRLAIGGGGGLRVWDIQSGKVVLQIRENTIESAAYHPSGKFLAVGVSDGTIQFRDAESGKIIRSVPAHLEAVHTVTFSHRGDQLASLGWDHTLRIFDLDSGKELVKILNQRAESPIAFSPDGKILALGEESGTIVLFDSQTGNKRRTFPGHQSAVLVVCFHPAGNRVVSAGMDRMVKVWDVATGEEALTLHGLTNQILGAAIDPQGLRIAAAANNQTLRIWSGEEPTKDWLVKRRKRVETGTRDWQQKQGLNAVQVSAWFAAEWFLDRGLRDGKGATAHLEGLGKARLHRGKLEASREITRTAWAREDARPEVGSDLALLERHLGDMKAHRAVVGELQKRFGKTRNPYEANNIAWACARFADTREEVKLVEKLARYAVSATPPPGMRGNIADLFNQRRDPMAQNTLGVVLYRIGGRDKEVIEILQAAIRDRDDKGVWADWLFLALAYKRLGEKDKAANWLHKVHDWKTTGGSQQSQNPVEDIEFRILWAELEEAMKDQGEKEKPQ